MPRTKYGRSTKLVMPGLAAFAEASAAERGRGPAKPWRRREPGIHVFGAFEKRDVDGRAFATPKRLRPRRRDKPGHDENHSRISMINARQLTVVFVMLACLG